MKKLGSFSALALLVAGGVVACSSSSNDDDNDGGSSGSGGSGCSVKGKERAAMRIADEDRERLVAQHAGCSTPDGRHDPVDGQD